MTERNNASTEACLRSTLVGICFSALLAAVKGIAGVVGHSHALIADAVESITDIFTSALVFGGIKIASRPPDASHPYGHGKAEPMAGILVSVGLLAAAFGITIQSVREISNPGLPPASFTLIILLVVILTKEGLYRFVIKIGENADSNAVKADAWHHRSDAMTSLAAFIGISIAILGGPGYEQADAYAALVASAVIFLNAIRLAKPAIAEIMDSAPSASFEGSVRTSALNVDQVIDLDVCYVRKMGLYLFVDLHVIVDGNLSVREGHRIAHRVKDAIRADNPRVWDILIHIEPDTD